MATTQTFPSSHTTTVTTTTTRVSPTIRFDPDYLRTLPGLLKIFQIILSLIGFICVEASCSRCSSSVWYSFVSMAAFWVSLTLLGFYLFHLIETLHIIPWLLAEFIYCTIWAFFYFIASLLVLIWSHGNGGYISGGFFGFVAMLLFGTDAFLKYKAWRNGEIAQGERKVTTTPAAAPPTAYPGY